MNTRRRMLGAAGALSGGLALAACGAQAGSGSGAGGTASDKTPLHIGASVSGTGSNGNIGRYQKEAYELWAEQVNLKGGVLGRQVRMTILDDASDPTTGTKLYEKLITEDKVDLVLGPYASSVTQAASTVTEKYKYPMLAAGASASDIWKRNYKYIFGVYSIAESYFYGVIDMALKNNLRKIAIVNEDAVFPNATAAGTTAYARQKGMQIVFQEKYPQKATDVSSMLTKVKAAAPDVLVGGSYEPDSMLITRQMKDLDVNVKMLAFSVGAANPDFYGGLTTLADYVFGPSMWEPDLKTPGNKEFLEAYKKKWSRDPDYHSATGYAGGQILEAAVKKANSLDKEKLRDALSTLETTTILPGKYKVDDTGAQTGHIPVTIQWQGKDKLIVSPDNVATGKAKLPMPEWRGR
ncbi:MAG: amino acid ABC transporter substrate-binding protein [Chloroflexota bacterium]